MTQNAIQTGGVIWRVTRTAWRTPLLAVAVIAAAAALVELAAHTRMVRTYVPAPSVGSPSRLFEQQLSRLEALRSKVNCVLLGSSLVLTGVDVRAFAEGYASRGGREINCSSLAQPGIRGSDLRAIANVVVEDYTPRLLLLGITLRDLSPDNDVGFANTAWLRYRAGRFDPEGWLIDHSLAYRYYLLYRGLNDPDRHRFVAYEFPLTSEGFLPADTRIGDPQEQLRSFAEKVSGVIRGRTSAEQMGDLAAILRLHGAATDIVVVYMPLHPVLSQWLETDLPTYRDQLVELEELITANGGIFLDAMPAQIIVPADGWADLWHLNRDGASLFGRWLGGHIAAVLAARGRGAPS